MQLYDYNGKCAELAFFGGNMLKTENEEPCLYRTNAKQEHFVKSDQIAVNFLKHHRRCVGKGSYM